MGLLIINLINLLSSNSIFNELRQSFIHLLRCRILKSSQTTVCCGFGSTAASNLNKTLSIATVLEHSRRHIETQENDCSEKKQSSDYAD